MEFPVTRLTQTLVIALVAFSFVTAPLAAQATASNSKKDLAAMPSPLSSTAPEQTKGISLFMMTKSTAEMAWRTAEMGPKKNKWGLYVGHGRDWKPGEQAVVIQTPQDFLKFVRAQNKEVQKNGIWIQGVWPDANYSDAEKKFLKDIRSLCWAEKIPLFIHPTVSSKMGDE